MGEERRLVFGVADSGAGDGYYHEDIIGVKISEEPCNVCIERARLWNIDIAGGMERCYECGGVLKSEVVSRDLSEVIADLRKGLIDKDGSRWRVQTVIFENGLYDLGKSKGWMESRELKAGRLNEVRKGWEYRVLPFSWIEADSWVCVKVEKGIWCLFGKVKEDYKGFEPKVEALLRSGERAEDIVTEEDEAVADIFGLGTKYLKDMR